MEYDSYRYRRLKLDEDILKTPEQRELPFELIDYEVFTIIEYILIRKTKLFKF